MTTQSLLKAKTVFLVVNSGFGARYLLRTDIFGELKRSGARIVIVTPNPDEPYFRQEFQGDDAYVEKLEVDRCLAYRDSSRAQRFLRLLRSHTLGGSEDNTTIEENRYLLEATSPRRGVLRRLYLSGVLLLTRVLSRVRWLRRLVFWIERTLYSGHLHHELFERYRPDLVVTTSLGYAHPDEYVMREARAHGAKVVPVILSWDNTSSKGMAGAPIDSVVAWTEEMQKELVAYHDFRPQRIFVGGVAHFDVYHRPEALVGREEIFERMGLDLDRKVIFYATKSPNSYPWNPEIAEMMAKAIEDGRLREPCQVVVRIHPLHFFRKRGATSAQSMLDEYQALSDRYPFVHVDEPEVLSVRLPLDTRNDDMVKIGSLMRETAVMVNMFSTMVLEACTFDVPVVNVAFEGDQRLKASPRHDIRMDERHIHNQRVVGTGGTSQVYSPDELIDQINAYLIDPSLHAEGRARIRQQECGPYPGTAGRQIAAYLRNVMVAGGPEVSRAWTPESADPTARRRVLK